MAKYGKWIGAGLGFVMGGPIGALFGYFIGSTFDTATMVTSAPGNDPGTRPTGRGDFLLSLVVLATALMKADGKVTRNELDYVKKFFRDNFGLEGEREALAIIKDLLNKDIEIDQVCIQIRVNMNVYSRTQLLYFLFGLAKADGMVCQHENRFNHLPVSQSHVLRRFGLRLQHPGHSLLRYRRGSKKSLPENGHRKPSGQSRIHG